MTDVWIFVSVVLLADYSALMVFYFAGWLRTRSYKTERFSPKTKVSVVIAARNEEAHIENCVRSILDQDYPKELFEIIVVDDFSEDRTVELLGAKELTSLRVPRFRIGGRSNPPVQSANQQGIASAQLSTQSLAVEPRNDGLIKILSSNFPGKKRAIETGIQNATGELIVTTDADCIMGEKWLSTAFSYYEKFHPKMIAAPVAFTHEKTWLEKWQSLDLCGMMAITAGATTNGFPNMCNGANLAYEKKVFEEVGGFSGIDNQPSGDDVMLMQKIARKYPGGVHFLKSQDAIVLTKPEKTLSGLFQQRLRWLSKGTAFPDWRVSAVLIFSYAFNLSIIVNLVAGIFYRDLLALAIVALALKTLVELPLLWSGCNFFQKKKLLLYILPAQVFHILYVVIVGGASRLMSVRWKGRKY